MIRLSSSSSTQLRRLLACHHQRQYSRSLNIFSIFSKEAVEKERQRLGDELNRGYFDDYRDLKKHSGKLATARQSLLPAATAVKFPVLPVRTANGEQLTLPVEQNIHDEMAETCASAPVTLVCIAFRGHGQGLVSSWVLPFINSFKGASNVRIYEVFYVDQWFLSLAPVRYLLLRSMRPKEKVVQDDEMKKVVYAFGDSYDFRKELHITNVLTGYVFLLDEQGRVRWQAYGQSTEEEVSSMVSCTNMLLNEQNSDA